MEFKTKQTGWAIVIISIVVCVFMAIAAFYLGQAQSETVMMSISIIIVFGLVLALFSTLETTVSEKDIKIKFGVGLIKKTIPLDSIESMTVVRNKFWYGWGIRLTPHGWLWNIAGYDAVEFVLKDNARKFRLGCADAKELMAEIKKRK